MTQDQFASLIGVTSMWLLQFEKGDMPLSKCRVRTQELVARAMIKLGVRLTRDGWELIDGGGNG
jgi:transcriptional regulator with XRE-family HTH domain